MVAKKIEKQEQVDNDICFIITPIGDDGSIIRKKADGLINNVLKPICNELQLKAIPAHEIDKPGSITNQVIQMIMDSKMVIANLTGLNPNVMYELAIRHAIKRPVVCLAEEGTKLPFDITTERTVFYSDDMYGATCLKSILKEKLISAIEDKNVDNPIYRATKEKLIIKEITSSDNKEASDSLLYILERLENIEAAIRPKNTESKILASCSDYLSSITLSHKFNGRNEELVNLIFETISQDNLLFSINDDMDEIFLRTKTQIPVEAISRLNKKLQEKYAIDIKGTKHDLQYISS